MCAISWYIHMMMEVQWQVHLFGTEFIGFFRTSQKYSKAECLCDKKAQGKDPGRI